MKTTLQILQPLNFIKEMMVGETGIEPATSWSRTKRATKLRYSPNGHDAMCRAQSASRSLNY